MKAPKKNPIDIIMSTTKDEFKALETDENYLVELNVLNSNTIEQLIENDPNYHFSQTRERFERLWQQKNHQLDFQDCYERVVKPIAIENSTRTSNENMERFARYMVNPEKRFFQRVQEGDIDLVDEMLEYVKDDGGRNDKSLASKICKYLNEWICNGTAYAINDSFVRKVLPYYLKKWGVHDTHKSFDNVKYKTFIGLINKLEEKVGCINKHQIDHILWYCYRSDPVRLEIAIALGKK